MKRRPARKRAFRGVLPVLVLLLAGSSALRFEDGIGLAFATVTAGPATAVETPLGHSEAEEEAVGMLIARLKAREAEVAAQEEALSQRALKLDRLAAEVSARLDELAKAEAALRATMALADAAAETDLTQLTAVYENMKPQDAAALFETMEPSFSAGFLARMKPASAAAIMAGLTPDKAYLVSLILSGRNIDAPTRTSP